MANEPSSVPPWMSTPGGPASELTTVAVLEPPCVMYGLATVGCSSVFAVTESSAASAAPQPANTKPQDITSQDSLFMNVPWCSTHALGSRQRRADFDSEICGQCDSQTRGESAALPAALHS